MPTTSTLGFDKMADTDPLADVALRIRASVDAIDAHLRGADLAWIALPYAANWADVGAGWQAGRYRLLPGKTKVRVEFFANRLTSVSGANAVIATLPAGFRPLATQILGALQAAGGVFAVNGVFINNAGQIITTNSINVGGSVPVFAEFPIN